MSATMRASRSPLRRIVQAGRCQRLDRGEEPDPQVGQDRERRPVGDVALEVAERGARDGQHADRGDREGHLGHVGDQRRLRDEPGRDRHQGHVRGDGQEARAASPAAIQRRSEAMRDRRRAMTVTAGRPSSAPARSSRSNGPSRSRKLRRPADLDHAPGLHDHHDVGGRHETEPVRHDHHGPPTARVVSPNRG